MTRHDDSRNRSRLSPVGAAAVVLAVAIAAASAVTAEDQGGAAALSPSAAATNEAELEVLRRLLGLPVAATAEAPAALTPAASDDGEEEQAAPAAQKVRPAPVRFLRPAAKPSAASSRRSSPSSARRTAAPQRPAVVAGTSPSSTLGNTSAPTEAEGVDDRTEAIPPPSTLPDSAQAEDGDASSLDVPPAGTIVSSANVERWKHLLGPSVQWSIERGATIEVVDPKPIPLERVRAEATQRYSDQVHLSADKRSMKNFVAGIPFPLVSEDDPDAAPKLMFNMENRINQDDLDIGNFSCDTGTLDGADGFSIQRHYEIENFRRFYHVGRLWVDPKPEWPDNQEGVRYREMLYPVVEPFDLKGSGFTYLRYLDPNRQDDSWLYFPQQKRVRRLGTAQRSEGVFGQDVDLDSYGGFAGNPAWTKWSFLGKKTILASMHARNVPSRFEKAPAAFFPEDVWEPREVWVILGVSQLGGYNFGRRVIYLDRETWIVPYTEIYDLKGGLWRTLIHTWNAATRPNPSATRSVYEDDTMFFNAFTLVDMQLNHATRCQFPSPNAKGEEGWYYRFGEAEGTTLDQFAVSNFIQGGR